MAHFAIATRTSAVPTGVRGPSLYSTAAVRPHIREIGIWNTTTTACTVGIVIASATGTQGAALSEIALSDYSHAAVATAFNTHTADATVSAAVRQSSLGAAIGSGVIWSWAEGQFVLDNQTTVGVVINCPTGTAQHLDFYIEWSE